MNHLSSGSRSTGLAGEAAPHHARSREDVRCDLRQRSLHLRDASLLLTGQPLQQGHVGEPAGAVVELSERLDGRGSRRLGKRKPLRGQLGPGCSSTALQHLPEVLGLAAPARPCHGLGNEVKHGRDIAVQGVGRYD